MSELIYDNAYSHTHFWSWVFFPLIEFCIRSRAYWDFRGLSTCLMVVMSLCGRGSDGHTGAAFPVEVHGGPLKTLGTPKRKSAFVYFVLCKLMLRLCCLIEQIMLVLCLNPKGRREEEAELHDLFGRGPSHRKGILAIRSWTSALELNLVKFA